MSEVPSIYIVIQEQGSRGHWYPFNQPQTLHTTGNLPALPAGAQDRRNLIEGKTLGSLQILIGVIYLGLGSILGTIVLGNYTAPSFNGGVPFWGGMLFIISGSLSVASEEDPNSLYLLRSYIITNIFSVITSVIETSLFITEMIINSPYNHLYARRLSGRVTSGILFIFSFLEFWIAFTCVIFGYQRNKSRVKA